MNIEQRRYTRCSDKSFLCFISFNAIITPRVCVCVWRAIVMTILQTGRLRLSIMQLGRGGAGTDTQICLTLVPAAIPRPPVLFPQVPHLWPLLQPGGVSHQAPGPCGYSPGGCADEAGGGGMGYISVCVGGGLPLLPRLQGQ